MELANSSPGTSPEKEEMASASVPSAAKRGRRTIRLPRKKWTYVLITWHDAITDHDPADSNDDFDLPVRKTIAHFLKRTKEAAVVCMEDDRGAKLEGDCQTVTSIPLGMICDVTVLVPKE